ncbi:hypothetical protein AcV5_003714 [Taiwanofungus camphoratus]|nr:hypothetical protein AcV5_003714 [Antrodia cinnamomea]
MEPMPTSDQKWFCFEGGSETITDALVELLRNKPICNARVTAISLIHKSEDPAVSLFHGDETPPGLVQVRLHDGRLKLYDHVINTATLPCLRAMDITSAKLSPAQSTALRELQYGPSTKIGVEFKTAWWEDACTMKKYGKYDPIVGGQ